MKNYFYFILKLFLFLRYLNICLQDEHGDIILKHGMSSTLFELKLFVKFPKQVRYREQSKA